MKVFRKITAAYLKQNKARTIITILGVIFSVTLITAIATSITSLQESMVESREEKTGNWYLQVNGLTGESLAALESDERIERLSAYSSLGFAKFDNDYPISPYLIYRQVSPEIFERFPIRVISGRLPEKEGEVLVPDNVFGDPAWRGESAVKIGDSYSETLGDRFWEDRLLTELDQVEQEPTVQETFRPREKKNFTIVGVYESGLWHDYGTPAFSMLTVLGSKAPTAALVTTKDADQVYTLEGELLNQGLRVALNEELLLYMGHSGMLAFYRVIYALGAILIFIVMFGSVLLIHNAFSISVGERTKQFGILASVGATHRQLSRMVYYEAAFVSLVGIVGGVALGLGGTAVVLRIFGDRFGAVDIGQINLHVNGWAILLAVAVSAVTVFWSARKPAARAGKTSPIEAVRQTRDIGDNPDKKQGETRLPARGYEKMLANRNFHRNRRMYRSTILSLFVSVVLFVSGGAIGTYLSLYIGDAVTATDYDVTYYLDGDRKLDCYPEIAGLEGVRDSTLVSLQGYPIKVNGNDESVTVAAVEDGDFARYAQKMGISQESCVAFNVYRGVDEESGKRYYTPIIDQEPPFTVELGEQKKPITVQKVVNQGPMGFSDRYGRGITLFLSQSTKERLLPNEVFDQQAIYIASQSPEAVVEKMETLLISRGFGSQNLFVNKDTQQERRTLITGVQVFALCFMALITLIAVANIFNTIGTNIALRRREFATLKSMGMGERSFSKMLRLECLIYGLKALLWGLPASFVMVVLVHQAINLGVQTPFTVPWMSIVFSIAGVFLLVFISMVYAVRKGNQESIVDAIKNENL